MPGTSPRPSWLAACSMSPPVPPATSSPLTRRPGRHCGSGAPKRSRHVSRTRRAKATAEGEPGYETWAAGSAEYSGNAGVWAPMSADPRTGAIFLPVENATADLYGGERRGSNLNASTLVSLDGRTGRVRWKRQLVHHD